MRSCIIFVSAVIILSCLGCQQQGNPEAEKAAVDSARAWLQLIDSGEYDKSYEQAAEFFKNAVTKQQHQKSMEAFRKPLGKLLSRELKDKKFTTELPGAPDGKYVLLLFETSFENKKQASERLVPMLDKDGKWRISGYFIN